MEKINNLNSKDIQNSLIQNVNWSTKSKIWLGFLSISFAICLYFYYLQLRDGLAVTGLNDYISWGMYISNFVFFIAASLIGMLISSIMGLMGIEWIKPISRIAEFIAVAFAMVAGLVIVTDMGRPDRLHHIFRWGRIQSPIVWDISVVMTYVTISVLLLYVSLIPDFGILLRKAPNFLQSSVNCISFYL